MLLCVWTPFPQRPEAGVSDPQSWSLRQVSDMGAGNPTQVSGRTGSAPAPGHLSSPRFQFQTDGREATLRMTAVRGWTPGKRDAELKNCLHQVGPWACT